jgi:hypothetical protein
MNIIMNMTLEIFSHALENNQLPQFELLKPRNSNDQLHIPALFRDINDQHSNYNEWVYNRRERLAYMTTEELFESSPYSFSWVDRKLERLCKLEETQFFEAMSYEDIEQSKREVEWYTEDGNKKYDIEQCLMNFQKIKHE